MTYSFTQSRKLNRWKLLLVSSTVCVVISLSLAGVKVALNRGFGASDLVPFFVWTIPLGVFTALISDALALAARVLRTKSTLLRYLITVVVGFVVGGLWTYFVRVFLGPEFDAFSFPVLTCWITGAASGLIAGSTYYGDSKLSIPIDLAIILLMCFAALIGDRALPRFWLDSRKVEVIAVKWTPGPEALKNSAVLGQSLPDKDLARLREIGLGGRIEYASSGSFGQGKPGRVIIVLSRQLKAPVTLPQPDGGEVVYVQTENGWKTYPANSPTLKRNIQLEVDERDPARVTRYYVENADRTRQGGTLVTW